MLGSTPIGTAVAGTGSAIILPITIGTGGNITATGTYTLTVQATAQTGACSGRADDDERFGDPDGQPDTITCRQRSDNGLLWPELHVPNHQQQW